MDMNIVTLPKKGLKTRPYNIDMNKEDQITTLSKRGLKTRPYDMDMEKKDLKTLKENTLVSSIDMNKRDLKKLTKAQLIRLLLKQQAQKPSNSIKQMVNKHEDIIQSPEQFRDTYKPIPQPKTGKWESVKPKPVPRKSVKLMVKVYEDIIQPPEQFRDECKPIPNQGLTDHFKCKMHEDCQKENHNLR